jgi:hypothetical protein
MKNYFIYNLCPYNHGCQKVNKLRREKSIKRKKVNSIYQRRFNQSGMVFLFLILKS